MDKGLPFIRRRVIVVAVVSLIVAALLFVVLSRVTRWRHAARAAHRKGNLVDIRACKPASARLERSVRLCESRSARDGRRSTRLELAVPKELWRRCAELAENAMASHAGQVAHERELAKSGGFGGGVSAKPLAGPRPA